MNYFEAIIDRGVPGTGPILLLHPRDFDVNFLRNNIDALEDLVGGPDQANATTFPTITGAFEDGDLGLKWNIGR
jgi:hypothetical protein